MEYSNNKKENTMDIFCKTQMNLKGIIYAQWKETFSKEYKLYIIFVK